MPKEGTLHDYDHWANLEASSRGVTCAVCEIFPMGFQWSDYSGEGMCTQCGCTYQLKWGSDKQKEKNNYPYLNLSDGFLPVAKEYWNEKQKFVCYGWMLGPMPGMAALVVWLKEHHPEHIQKKEETK